MSFTFQKILVALGLLGALAAAELPSVYAATISSTPANSLTSGLVGWWTMDGVDTPWTSSSAGTTNDKSRNGGTGTLRSMSQSISPTTGIVGQALNFRANVGEYVEVSDNDRYSFGDGTSDTPFSISAWVYYSGVDPAFTLWPIISKWNNTSPANAEWSFYVVGTNSIGSGGANALTLQINSGGGVTNRFIVEGRTSLVAGRWYHVVATYDGSSTSNGMKLFLNSAQDTTDTQSDGTYTAMSNLAATVDIGAQIRSNPTFDGFAKGKIDDVRIYNRSLSTTEIRQLYNQGSVTKVAVPAPIIATSSCSTGLSCGLVGYWTMDGKDTPWTSATAATTLDESGSGNTGTLTSMNQSKAPVQGKIGQGLKFDGVDDTVSIAHNASIKPTAAISINFWFNPSNVNSSAVQTILSTTQSGGYSVALNGTSASGTCNANSFCFFVNVGGTYYITNYAKSNFKNNTWYLFTGTYDGNTNRMYINGQQIDTVSQSGTINYTSNTPVCLASEPNASACIDGNYFNGLMDDVRVYNRALSAVEVRQLYNLGATSKQAVSPVVTSTSCSYGLSCGLLGYWTFDGKDVDWSTGLASDKSGNLNTGSMLNMSTTSSPIPGKSGQGLRFDGVNDAINAGSTSSLTDIQNQGGGGMTVAFWINPDSNSTKYILAKGGANNGSGTWSILKASNTNPARLSFNKEGGTDASKNYNSLLVSGVWQHIVLTWDGTMAVSTGVLVYRNGVLVSNVTGTDGASANSDSGNALCMGNLSTIGSANCTTSGSADMKLDDVMIYNRVLSAAEVRQLYNRSK